VFTTTHAIREEFPVTTTLPGLATELQTLFTTTAREAAQASQFIIRKRVLDGPSFVQGLVFGWLANPHATLEELAHSVAGAGAALSPQALQQRFTPTAAECLRHVLADAVKRVIGTQPRSTSLLQRFQGVYLLDSTTIPLPAALATLWRGCGGTAGTGRAALKVQVRWELTSGTLDGVGWSEGRAADAKAELASSALPAGALRIADLGYFDLGALAQYTQGGVLWLTRIAPGTRVVVAGRRWELGAYLKHVGTDRVDRDVQLGTEEQVPCRLVAVRVPDHVAAHRRQQVRRKAGKSGHRLSAQRLALCAWTVVATNIPPAQATLDEVLILLRVRWQLELLFKSWKSSGVGLDESSSAKAWRVLCEVYAKLLGAVVRQWVVAVNGAGGPCASVIRSGRVVQRCARELIGAFSCPTRMVETLAHIKRVLGWLKPVNKRKKRLATHQTLTPTTTSA
jgi:hypothetical protein